MLCAVGALIVVPLLDELARFADRAPDLLNETKAGRGPLGQLLERFCLRRYAEAHADFVGVCQAPGIETRVASIRASRADLGACSWKSGAAQTNRVRPSDPPRAQA